MTNVDTKEVIETNSDMYSSAGLSAWISLVPMPAGRYYWSKYEPDYRIGLEQSIIQYRPVEPRSPGLPDEVFEIVPGVINYAGDWTIRKRIRDRWVIKVNPDIKTLQHLVDSYPEYANSYEVYLTLRGSKPISLPELQQRIEAESETSPQPEN